MSPEEVREAALRVVERTTAAHGVPRYVEDEKVLRRVAAMLDERRGAPPKRSPKTHVDPSTSTKRARSEGTPDERAAGATRGRR